MRVGRASKVCVILALAIATPAAAQYVFDPNNFDETGPGTKFFGSAKDDHGKPVIGVTILIAHTFVLVTDYTGYYRGNIAPGTPVTAPVECSKPGFTTVRVARRLGPAGPKKSVQVDCVLRAGK